MKILHIISQKPDATGSGFTLRNFLDQAQSRGHLNGLVAGIARDDSPYLQQVLADNSWFVRFPGPNCHFPLPGMSDVMPYSSSVFSQLSADQIQAYTNAFRATIRQAVKRFQPDLIHSHHLWLVSSIARQEAPAIPMVTSCHSTDLRQLELCPHLREDVVAGCNTIDRVLALSHQQIAKIQDVFSIPLGRIDVVGGGFSRDLFNGRLRRQKATVQLLYAGKLSLAKGVDWLLKVFRTLQNEDLHLHLAGSGTGQERDLCLQLAGTCNNRITLHGRLNQSNLASLMARCDIFILPSFYEGLPLVLLEALASGCRLITTDLPGCRELLAGLPPEICTLIPLPEQRDLDRPFETDMPLLEKRLAEAMLVQSEIVRQTRQDDLRQLQHLVDAKTASYDWGSVYSRVETSYRKAMDTGG